VLVGVAAVAAIAFVVARAWIGRSGDAVAGDRPTSTTADASTTTSRDGGNWPGTTLPASHTDPNADCDSVLITWLEYANQPAHSFEEVVGLLGRRSPEWSAIDEAWTTFQARLETEERSQAVRAVLDVVARRCEGFADGFVPRSVPTGG